MLNLRIAITILFLSSTALADWDKPFGLTLSPADDFSIGTDVYVESVKEIDIKPFNKLLLEAQETRQTWVTNFFEIALRIPGLGLDGDGIRKSITVEILPLDWEVRGVALEAVRISIENSGWMDDSVTGERHVVWLMPDFNGLLQAKRILWAQHCSRHWDRHFFSAGLCP
jgi:hypothetical protein